jgi:hypothetical protein
MVVRHRMLSAAKASATHLLLSLLVALLAATLVFGLWYPFPYRELMGGRELFVLVVSVDVVCGPLLTLVLYDPKKPRAELIRDLALVAIVQLAALLYGLHAVMVARPVYLVFEVDHFTAVSAVEIDEASLAKAQAQWNRLPLFGPSVISVRQAKDAAEANKSVELSFQGVEPSMRPDWWQPLEVSKAEILAVAAPLAILRKRYAHKPDNIKMLDTAVLETGKPEESLRWLPLISRRSKDWIALIDAETAIPLAYAAVDGF